MEAVISPSEWQVMRVLWAYPGSTSQFIIQSLQEEFDWQPATIKTLLGRLRKKAYLRMDKEEKKYRYWPLIGEEEHLRLQLQTILENSCSTKNTDLVLELLIAGSYSQGGLQQIRATIDELLPKAPEKLTCHCLPGQCTCGHHH